MKKTSKIFSVFLALILSLLGSVETVFASEPNIGLCEKPTYFIETYGINKPYNSEWDLSKEGKYNFSGWCKNNYLYTNYTFTGASSVRI